MAPIVHLTILVFVYLWQAVYIRTCQHSLCYFWLLWNHNTVSSFFCHRLWGLSLDSVNESTWSAWRLRIHSCNLSRRESGCETKDNYLRRTEIRQMYWRRRSSLHTSTSITQPMEEYSYVGGRGSGRSSVLQRSLIILIEGERGPLGGTESLKGGSILQTRISFTQTRKQTRVCHWWYHADTRPQNCLGAGVHLWTGLGLRPPTEPVYTTSVMWLKAELEVTQLHALLVPPFIYIFGYLRFFCLF